MLRSALDPTDLASVFSVLARALLNLALLGWRQVDAGAPSFRKAGTPAPPASS
jgi:hypothetical protein